MTAARHISDDMQALLDAAVDAIILIDHRGRMLLANRSAERMFGYRHDELVGNDVAMLMPEAERPAHGGHIDRYLRTGEARVIGRGREVVALRRDGTLFPAQLSVGRVAGAEPPRFAGFVYDLTEQRAMDSEMRRTQERLSQVARFASMGELAAGMAHELNQPLAAIATYAQACDRLLSVPDPDIPAIHAALRETADQALRAGEIIRRLRQLVSGRRTEQRLEDLNEIVRDLDSLAGSEARHQGVTLQFALEPGELTVTADRIQLQQVLLNLLRNAAEAVEELPAARREIVIGTRRAGGGEVEAFVRDAGPGVAKDAADAMFDPFFTTKAEGTGLGLAISRTIARAHHGSLGYRDVAPHGAEFFVRLPGVPA